MFLNALSLADKTDKGKRDKEVVLIFTDPKVYSKFTRHYSSYFREEGEHETERRNLNNPRQLKKQVNNRQDLRMHSIQIKYLQLLQ